MKKILTVLLLLACTGPLVRAQSTVIATFNDLIVGFRATNSANGAGTDRNLEINLGNVGQFYGLPANTTVTLGNLGADLADVYDLIWNERSDLTWGLAGTTGAAQGTTIKGNAIAASTLWGSRTETTAGIQSVPWNQGASEFSQQGAANKIATLYVDATGSLNGKPSTANSTNAAVIDSSLTGSWSKQEGTTASAFTFFNPKSQFERSTNFSAIVGSFAVLDLYEVQPLGGPGTYIGSFALNSAGLLQFSNSPAAFGLSAIPEPSACAALLGVAMLGLAVFRRRAAGCAAGLVA